MEFALGVADSEPLPESVHALLVDLMNRTGETMMLAAPQGTSVTLLDVVETAADIRYIVNVGQRLPIHITAAGRAILAQYPDSEREATLNSIKYTSYEKTAFMTADAVERDIQQSARNGWYFNPGDYQAGVAGIAVPFPFKHHRYAVVLGGPVSRIENRVSQLGKLLKKSVARFLKENMA
jgi:DNA-binding IclR family transcriptional regulator